MKLMQRFLGLLMALAMLFSLSAEAFAEIDLLRLSGNGIAAAEDGSDPSEGDVPASGNESAQPKDEINIVETEEPEGEIPIIDPELVAKEYGESRTLKATDDKTYSVQVDIGEKAGIPKGIELAVREILPGEAGYDAYVRQSAEALKEKLDNLALVRVFDISLRDPISGNEYQPNDKVKVSIRLLDAKLNATEKLDVVHFGDEVETVRCALEGESVSFDTEGFSVYVVIGHEGDDTVDTPRVEFHFINSDFTDNNNGTYTASGYRFVNKHSEYQYTQILRNGEYLEMIDNPPNLMFVSYEAAGSFVPGTIYYVYDDATRTYVRVTNPVAGDIGSYFVKNTSEKYFYGWYAVTVASGADNVNWKTGGAVDTAKPAKVTYSWPEDKKVDDETELVITGPQKTVEENGVTKKVYLVNGVETAYGASETVPEGATPVYKGLDELRVGDTVTWTIGAATGTAVLDAEGTGHVYLVPAFQDFYFVNFHMGNKEATDALKKNLLTRRLVVFGTTDIATVRIGDIRCPSPDPEHRIFSGWETVEDDGVTTKVYYQTIDPETGNEKIVTVDVDGTQTTSAGNGYYIKLQKDAVTGGSTAEVKTLDVYPVFAEARWLYYDVGSSGNGALYVAAAYRLTNDDSMGTGFSSLSTSRRSGYDFAGWYVNAAMVDNVIKNLTGDYDVVATVKINGVDTQVTTHYNQAIQLTDASGNFVDAVKGKVFYVTPGTPADTETVKYSRISCGSTLPDGAERLFEVKQVEGVYYLFMYKDLDSLTVGARWDIVSTTSIRVIIWKQKVTDNKNTVKTPADLLAWLAEDRTRKAEDYPYAVKEYDYEIFYTNANASTANAPDLTRFSGSYLDANGDSHDVTNLNLTTLGTNTPNYLTGFTGFHYSTNDAAIVGKPNPDGTSVYNVYYDRNLLTIKWQNGNSAQTVDGYEYSETTSTNATPTQYGWVNGQYVELTRIGDSAPYTWGIPKMGDVYTASSAMEEEMYGYVNGQYVLLTPVYSSTTFYVADYRYTATSNNNGTQYKLSGDEYNIIEYYNPNYYGNGNWYHKVGTANNGVSSDLTYVNGQSYYFRSEEWWGVSFSSLFYNNSKWRTQNQNNNYYNYTGNIYQQYTGTRYARSDDGTTDVTNDPTLNTTDLYYIDSNGGKVSVTANTTTIISGYTYNGEAYTDTRYTKSYGPTGEYVPYTGIRYVRGANGVTSFTGLYGQRLSQYGYVWPSAYRWTSTNGGNQTLTFLDAFLFDGLDYATENKTLLTLYRATTASGSTIYFYKQNQDGTWTNHNQVNTSGGTFSITDKYNGFTAYTYQRVNHNGTPSDNGWTNVGAKGDNGVYGSGIALSGGQYTTTYYDLHIRFRRNAYDFTFDVNYPSGIDVTFSGGKSSNLTVSDIYYEASLSGCSGYYGVNSDSYSYTHALKGPDHYSFKGWYEDASCTVRFNFNSTMPAANKIVYAKWEPDQYLIKINPNGAEIDHIDHTGASYASFTNPTVTPLNRGQVSYQDEQHQTVVERTADAGYDKSRSTYFFADYNETVGEYAVSRSHVPISDVAAEVYKGTGRHVYAYVNIQYQGGNVDGEWGVPSHLRDALYVDATYGLGQYKNGDPAQGETEIYQLYKFYHDYLAYEYNSRPGYWDCDGAHDLPFASWKALFMDKKDDGTPQLYRKCNSKESWVFLGWFDDDDGTGMPYDFTKPITGPFTLTAHWRLDGGYKIQYTPEYYMPDSGDWINGEMRDGWIDPPVEQGGLSYTDGATTTVFKQPTNVTRNGDPVTDDSLIFRGWRIVSVSMGSNNTPIYTPLENGVYYDPGDSLTIDVQYADVNNMIHMQAVYEDKESAYRRPDITNLTLDANGGFLVTGTNGPRLNENRNLPWEGVGIILMDAGADTIGFGNIQTSAAVHLYQYATDLTYPGGETVYLMDDQGHYVDAEGHVVTEAERVEDPSKKLDPEGEIYFENYWQDRNGQLQRYFLLGFDDEFDEGDFVATYPADSVVAVTRNDNQTIYAVWEPRIYLNVKNDTAIPDIGYEGGDVTFALSSTDMGTLEIVNEASGVYERIPLTNLTEITVHPGETLRISFPKGDDGSPVTLSGVNSLGPGMLLSAASSFDGSPRNPDPTGEFTNIKNTKPFDISDTLEIHDEGVVITFTSVRNPHTLVLDDNYSGGGQQEIYFSKTLDNVVYLNTPDATSYSLPSTSTRLGFEFVGWDPDQNWASNHNVETEYPAYNVNDWTIDSLTDFFTSDGSSEPDISLQHLYAVWKVNADATKVYVYKNVPDPGSQEKDFTFTVSFSGKYTYSVNMSTTSSEQSIPEMRVDVALHHGQYIRVTSTKHIGKAADAESEAIRSYVDILVEKFDPDGTPLNVVGNTKQHHMRWEWSQWDENVQNLRNITFTEQNLSVSEADYTGAYYDTDLEIAGTTTNFELTKASGRQVTWDETDAGGTVVFTNTRQTRDVVVSKTLVSNSSTARTFEFKASYTLQENVNGQIVTTTEDFGSFTVTSGQSFTLKDIPVNAAVTVEELGKDLCDYETTVTVNGTAKNSTETVEGTGEDRVYTRKVAFSLTNEPTTVNFTNSVKYYKVTFYKVDQNKQPGVEAFFKLSSSTDTLIPNVNTGVFYSTDRMYAGDYTLTETWVDSESYIGLNGPISLKLTGADNGKLIASPSVGDEAKVIVEGNAQSGFNVYVFNQRIIDFSITKVLDDVLLTTTRKFHFNVSYSYTMNGKTVNVIKQGSDAAHSVTESDGHGGTIVTVYEPAVELNGGQTITLKIPVGATGLKVQEDTTRLANATDKMYETYDTTVVRTGSVGTVTIKNSEDVHPERDTADLPGAVYAAAIAVGNNGDTITFTNKRKTVDVTISKTVIGDDKDGEFEFEIYVLNGRLPIKGYTVYDAGTTAATDDWVTDSSGLIQLPDGVDEGDDPDPFTLHHYTSAADAKTITIPVGATITVEEKLTSAQETKGYAVFMTMPGRDIKLVDGRADKIELIGPTENQTIRVFNIPSICKVTDADGNLLYVLQEGSEATNDAIYIPAIFPTIKGAFEGRDGGIGGLGNYYGKQADGSYNHYTDTSLERQYQIQMLVDYQVPNTDVVEVDPGYNLVFTTASTTAGDGYPFRRQGAYTGTIPAGVDASESIGKAVLSRPSDATAAFFTVNKTNANTKTIFEMSKLILDGGNATLTAKGGALTAYNTQTTIEDCVIFQFEAQDGGAVYTTGDSLTVKNSVFDTCISDLDGDGKGGGGINTTATTLRIEDSTFAKCSSIFQGGAVYHYGGRVNDNFTVTVDSSGKDKTSTISNCEFIDCVSRAGGGVQADVGSVTVTGCKFIRCKSEDNSKQQGTNGGGLNNYTDKFSSYASTLDVSNCTFQGCVAIGTSTNSNRYGGGGLRSTAKTTTLTGCTFEDDTTDPANPIHCESKLYGGGAAFTNPDGAATVSGCTFTNCTATSNGGGIYSVGTLTMNDATLDTCSAKAGGGAYSANSVTATKITVKDCNATNGSGGGIYSTGAASITGVSSLKNCTASSNGGGVYGGSTVSVTGTATVQDCTASSNGGGVYCSAALTMTGATVDTCTANNGGGVYTQGLTASGATVKNCSAANGSGGGVYSTGNLSITGTTVDTCTATSNGGGVYVSAATATLNGNTVITGCTASSNGGGVYLGGSTQATMSGNTSINKCSATSNGGGVYVNTNAKLTMSGSAVIDGNGSASALITNATSGGGVYVKGTLELAQDSSAEIRDCKVSGEGGAILSDGTGARVNVKGGTISGNQATGYGGGAIRVIGGLENDATEYNVTISGGTISGNSAVRGSQAEVYGGAINIKKGTVLISDGSTISENYAQNDNGTSAMGGAIHLSGAKSDSSRLTITGGTISGNYVRSANKAVYGGAISLRGSNAKAEISGNVTITGNYVNSSGGNKSALGGAIYAYENAVVNLSGGTISGNYAQNTNTPAYAKGAGIYLAEKSTLNISGSPDFGGNGIANAETGELNNSSGNLLDKAPGGTNGGQVYTKERQDIYLAGYEGEDAPSIQVTGEIDSGLGTIWVWAEKSPHYIKDEQFAVITGTSVSADSLAAFRDAQIDTKTTSTNPLYGVRDPHDATRVIWGLVGGAELSFQKVDSFGQPLEGASFSLYTDAACTAANIVTVTLEDNGANTAFTSNAQGKASCIVPTGLYYMKENDWAAGAGYENNTAVYVVLVGTYLTVPDTRTDVWNEVLSLINQDDIDAQRGKDDQNQFIRDCAVFLYDATNQKALPADLQIDAEGKVTSVPDIAARGILNIPKATRPVILSKINSSLEPLSGGQFTILRYDLTVVATGLTSDESGVYFVGQLPYGTYYVLETKQPDGYQLPDHYFVFTISADGVKNEGAKSTNTLRASTNDDYRVNP